MQWKFNVEFIINCNNNLYHLYWIELITILFFLLWFMNNHNLCTTVNTILINIHNTFVYNIHI